MSLILFVLLVRLLLFCLKKDIYIFNLNNQFLKGLVDVHLLWGQLFTESTDLDANFIWKHPHRHPEIIFNLDTLQPCQVDT